MLGGTMMNSKALTGLQRSMVSSWSNCIQLATEAIIHLPTFQTSGPSFLLHINPLPSTHTPHIPVTLNFMNSPYFLISRNSPTVPSAFMCKKKTKKKKNTHLAAYTDCSRFNSRHSSRKPSPRLDNVFLLHIPSAPHTDRSRLELYHTDYFRKLDKNNYRQLHSNHCTNGLTEFQKHKKN